MLLRRFNEHPLVEADWRGLDADNRGWPDDDTAALTGSGPRISIQDVCVVNNSNNKWEKIKAYLDEAKKELPPKTLYLNFTSGYNNLNFGIPNIFWVHEKITPRLKNYFEDQANGNGRYGVVIMDFACGDLTKLIYEKNNTSASAATTVP